MLITFFKIFNYIVLFLIYVNLSRNQEIKVPVVVSTWNFTQATKVGWETLKTGSALDAVESACSECEVNQCDGSVGYGGSPDENSESTLDAMIMDGGTMEVGSVANLRNIKEAISVARSVIKYSKHSMLVGDLATNFAVDMGFKLTNLSTPSSIDIWKSWKKNNCQPNFRKNVKPDPDQLCGPYRPANKFDNTDPNDPILQNMKKPDSIGLKNGHDTIGAVAVDSKGYVSAGTSTNGARYKIPGRVGDSPIIGSGSYADNEIGGAVATGDGDIMMRFVPSFQVLQLMRSGSSIRDATNAVIRKIAKFYPNFSGAVLAVDIYGNHGAACYGMKFFPYTMSNGSFNDDPFTVLVPCYGND